MIDNPFCSAHGYNKSSEVRIRRIDHFRFCSPKPNGLGRSVKTWIDIFELVESNTISFGLAMYPSEAAQNRMRITAISYFWVGLVDGSSTFESSNCKLCRCLVTMKQLK